MRNFLFIAAIISVLIITGCSKESITSDCLGRHSIDFSSICEEINDETLVFRSFGTVSNPRIHHSISRIFQQGEFSATVSIHLNIVEDRLTEELLMQELNLNEISNSQKLSLEMQVECNGVTYSNMDVTNTTPFRFDERSKIEARNVRARSNTGTTCSLEDRTISFTCTLDGQLRSENGKRLDVDNLTLFMQLRHH